MLFSNIDPRGLRQDGVKTSEVVGAQKWQQCRILKSGPFIDYHSELFFGKAVQYEAGDKIDLPEEYAGVLVEQGLAEKLKELPPRFPESEYHLDEVMRRQQKLLSQKKRQQQDRDGTVYLNGEIVPQWELCQVEIINPAPYRRFDKSGDGRRAEHLEAGATRRWPVDYAEDLANKKLVRIEE